MAEKEESATAAAETKKIINPRAEIDTSPPFESVKEAVDHFGGRGPWIPHHLLRLPPPHNPEALDLSRMEEQAVKFEKDLIVKEQEALNVLKEVEAAKRFVEGLKVNLMEEVSTFMSCSECKFPNGNSSENFSVSSPVQSPGYVLMELNQAKLDLNKMSVDLAVIRTSVESLNKKVKNERTTTKLLEGGTESLEKSMDEHKEVEPNFESEQFKKMAEASRYEVMKAMSEIERTKASIKMAEMRLNAAKKMEEAAKAVEAIAFAERKSLMNGKFSSEVSVDGITLPYEEYFALTQKAQQVEDFCKMKFVDSNTQVATQMKLEENTKESRQNNKYSKQSVNKERTEESILTKFKNSNHKLQHDQIEPDVAKRKPFPVFRSSVSIGDVLSRKLILRDDIVVGKRVESHTTERQHVSFSQMLREQSGIILNPTKPAKDGNLHKQYITQRKKFGFIQVPLPKQHKKKAQPANLV